MLSGDGDGRSPNGAPPEALVERFQELSASLERIEDPRARAGAQELIGVVLDLYGEGLSGSSRPSRAEGEGAEPAQALADDGVVASLMLIHDLYPVDLRTRVLRRSTESGPIWNPTAATSSSSGSRTAWRGSG